MSKYAVFLKTSSMVSFFVIVNNSIKDSWSDVIWSEGLNNQHGFNVKIYNNPYSFKSSILKKINKIHFSNKLNNRIWMPFKSVWDKFNIFVKDIKPSDDNYLIFQSSIKISPHLIKKLKKEYNCKIIVYMPDVIRKIIGIKNKKQFQKYTNYYQIDKWYSFDYSDCLKYDLSYFDLYSKVDISTQIQKYSICYVGSCREKQRLEILNFIQKKVGGCSLHITGLTDKDFAEEGIIVNKPMSYLENLYLVNQSKCILEIVSRGQKGNTLKAKEAICYNKMLLTNNHEIRKSRFYNPNTMIVFDDVEEIDFSKLLSTKCKVDYQYDNSFSPDELFIKILEETKDI